MIRRLPLMLLLACSVAGPASATDVQKLVQETQRTTQSAGQMTMVFWMPQAFWEASMNNNPTMNAEMRSQILALLDDYMIFAVLRAKIGAGGSIEARPKTELADNARLEVGGKTIQALAPEAITPGAQAVLAGLKPTLAGLLGAFGQGMELFVYPSHADGKALIDPLKSGTFGYTLYDQHFSWRLPLGSLLPARVDPKTNEEFPGNYDFSPYTGAKLQTRQR